MNTPDTGDHLLANTVTSPTAGSNCPAGERRSRLHRDGDGVAADDRLDVSPAVVTPGATVNETTTITNTGQTPYDGISVSLTTANTAAQISDAGNETASSGTLSVGRPGQCGPGTSRWAAR